MNTEEPPLPPNPELLNRQPKWFKPVFYGCIIASALFVLAILATAPVVHRSPKRSDQTEATNNLRQIGFALLEFDEDFGSYPSEATAQLVTKQYPNHGHDLSGSSSNALFRQLFAAELTETERMFYAKIPGVRKPDGDISPGKLLEKGEVGFAYVAGLSSKGNPARPIAFAPIIPGTDRFDPKPFEGNAVFLRGDNSVTSLKIGKDGRAYSGGFDILSPENPIWDGIAPDIRYPE